MTSLSRASASLGRDTRQLMLLRHIPEERHALLKAPGADDQLYWRLPCSRSSSSLEVEPMPVKRALSLSSTRSPEHSPQPEPVGMLPRPRHPLPALKDGVDWLY